MKKVMALLFVLGSVSISAQVQTNEVNSTGKIGINTTSPTTELEVKGKTKLDGETEVVGYTIMKDCVKVEKKLSIDQDIKVQGESVLVGNAKAKADMKVMGTTKMKGNAFVEGNFKFKGLADQTATDDRFLMINPNGKATSLDKAGLVNSVIEGAYGSDCFTLPGLPYPLPTWKSSSNSTTGILYTGESCPASVGIGTATPTAKLEVIGDARFTHVVGIGLPQTPAAMLSIGTTNPTRKGIHLTMPNVQDGEYAFLTTVENDLAKAIAVNRSDNNNEEVFRVYGDGLVEAKRLRLSLNIWSDYVFDETYELMPLEEVEEFVEKNHHLPNVPSETEMKEDGLDVGEMDAKLLEKIEELTLYLIELNKEVSELKEENETLKKAINQN